jgi:hypothetical protein
MELRHHPRAAQQRTHVAGNGVDVPTKPGRPRTGIRLPRVLEVGVKRFAIYDGALIRIIPRITYFRQQIVSDHRQNRYSARARAGEAEQGGTVVTFCEILLHSLVVDQKHAQEQEPHMEKVTFKKNNAKISFGPQPILFPAAWGDSTGRRTSRL